MNITYDRLIFGFSVVGLLCAGCASDSHFQPVSNIPPGRGLVYIYATSEDIASSPIWHNGDKLGNLTFDQYLVHFPEPGTNSYEFHMNYFSRGGLIGMLTTQHDPESTLLRVKEGRTYYLKLIGNRMGASLWRQEESAALEQLHKCHLVEVEKAKRIDASKH